MMEKKLDDFAKDLAIEIEVGGDRFDRLDFAYILYSSGLKPEGVEDFRKKVSSFIDSEVCPDDFLKKQLDYWLPDWICELGEFETNLENNSECSCIGLTHHRIAANVFSVFDRDEPDSGYEVLYSRSGERLHEGTIACVETEKENGKRSLKASYFIESDCEDPCLYAMTDVDGYSCGEKPGLLRVHMESGKAEFMKFEPSNKLIADNLKEVFRSGMLYEVASAAFNEKSIEPEIPSSEALLRGMREWDITPVKSLKI